MDGPPVLASVPVVLAKIPLLAGVDHHDRQRRSCQGRHQGQFQTARSLQYHHSEVQGGHAGNQFPAPCLVVREAPALAPRAYGNVHLSLSAINTYVGRFLVHSHLVQNTGPSLHDAGLSSPGNLYDAFTPRIGLFTGWARRARRRQLGEPGGTLDCTGVQYDTLPAALVAPNGYTGFGPASTSVEDTGIIKPGG